MKVLYPIGKQGILDGTISLSTDDIRALPVDEALYTYAAPDDNLDNIASGARCAAGVALTSKTFTTGTFDAANLQWPVVDVGVTVTAVAFYQHTGVDNTSRLIAFVNEDASGNPISIAGNGAAVNLSINASGIFTI